MLDFTEDIHMKPYMVMQKRCVWNKTFYWAIVSNFHNISFYVMVMDDDENVENLSSLSVTKVVLKFYPRHAMISTMEAYIQGVVYNSDVAQCNKPIKTASGQ